MRLWRLQFKPRTPESLVIARCRSHGGIARGVLRLPRRNEQRPTAGTPVVDLKQSMGDGRKYFGTDGVRGRVSETPITPEFVMRLGWAAGRCCPEVDSANPDRQRHAHLRVHVRVALEAGLISAGIISQLGPMPPAIAYLTQTLHADAGIVVGRNTILIRITALSFLRAGTKLPDSLSSRLSVSSTCSRRHFR